IALPAPATRRFLLAVKEGAAPLTAHFKEVGWDLVHQAAPLPLSFVRTLHASTPLLLPLRDTHTGGRFPCSTSHHLGTGAQAGRQQPPRYRSGRKSGCRSGSVYTRTSALRQDPRSSRKGAPRLCGGQAIRYLRESHP